MTTKRRRERDDSDRRAKRQRRRKRSNSEPITDTDSAEKRQALRRLFGRFCSVEIDRRPQRDEEPPDDDADDPIFADDSIFADENEDPLLEAVPVDMDPEQLGFLVCAQETLRFLSSRGISPEHPVFARLRLRLLRGIGELAVA